MRELKYDTASTLHGLRVITLDNGLLRLQILPEAGARVWQISYLPLGVDLLRNNPVIPPSRNFLHDSYDDVWSGGWDELFPNDEEMMIGGEKFPDHGELWSGNWHAEPFSSHNEVGCKLSFKTPLSCVAIEKTVTLRPDRAKVYCHYNFTNLGSRGFPFLWKLHPALYVTPQHRIDFPTMHVVREPAFAGTLEEAPLQFRWPYAHLASRTVDLRRVPSVAERELYFFYGTQMEGGWCALTNTATQLSCGLKFDPELFPSCWLFASYGGWRNYDVAVLEPSTGYPLNFDAMLSAGRHRTLAPGQTLATDVLFTVQRGVASVSHIDDDGKIFSEPRSNRS